jgi:hypothetical protein
MAAAIGKSLITAQVYQPFADGNRLHSAIAELAFA